MTVTSCLCCAAASTATFAAVALDGRNTNRKWCSALHYGSLEVCLLFTLLFQGRLHLMVWVGSFVTGTANDAFFMALPIVDNFWQVG